ncbi:hypothetical protein ACQKWADRAFT_192237 [Trichoderma austrokoningii]
MPPSQPRPRRQVVYAIAWIVPDDMAFYAALRVLQPQAGADIWIDEAPADAVNGPHGYTYTYRDLHEHHVFLANARDAAHITRCAEIMNRELKIIDFQVQMFLVCALDTFETCPDGLFLNTNNCVVDCYGVQNHSRSIKRESERNARRLLTAVANLMECQAADGECLYRAWPAYQEQYLEPQFATHVCRAPGFRNLPCLRFTGLCHYFDMTPQTVDYAYEVAAETVWELIHNLPKLEATAREIRD